jgi:acetolactate synthase-1/2/3 large subunit
VVALGGGATGAGRLVEELAVKLDAPVTLTQNGKGLLPSSHALLVKGSPTSDEIRNLYAEADYVLAIGTEFSETDYDFFFNGQFRLDSQRVIRIDNCLFQLAGNVPGRRSLLADSRLAVEALLPHIIERDRGGASRVRNINEKLLKGYLPQFEVFFDCLNSVLGDVILVGDSTKPAYMAASQYHPNGSRRFFSAATGFGTLGFALPAAIGAKLACPDTPVVALVGDGGIQFTLNELSVCIEHEIPIILIVWNNNSYDMIVEGFHDAGLEPIACTPPHPDFMKLAQAYGCGGIIANSPSELRTALAMARSMRVTVLIEINEAEFFNSCAF